MAEEPAHEEEGPVPRRYRLPEATPGQVGGDIGLALGLGQEPPPQRDDLGEVDIYARAMRRTQPARERIQPAAEGHYGRPGMPGEVFLRRGGEQQLAQRVKKRVASPREGEIRPQAPYYSGVRPAHAEGGIFGARIFALHQSGSRALSAGVTAPGRRCAAPRGRSPARSYRAPRPASRSL